MRTGDSYNSVSPTLQVQEEGRNFRAEKADMMQRRSECGFIRFSELKLERHRR